MMTLAPRKTACLLLLGCALIVPALTNAAPAPWYAWRSKADGRVVCAQTPLGPGWARLAGPYRDAHCEKPTGNK
jgi:hypothetical protein